MSSLRIRLASVEDLAVAGEISDRAYAPLRKVYRPKDAAISQRDETKSDYDRLVGEWDDQIVATLEYRVASGSVHVRGLAVDPDHQGRGVGRRMIDELLEIGRSQGRKSITLYTIRETGNITLFEHLGFFVVAEEVATWCESDQFAALHETKMERTISGCRARAPGRD